MNEFKNFLADVGILGFIFTVVISVALCPFIVFYLLCAVFETLNEKSKEWFEK